MSSSLPAVAAAQDQAAIPVMALIGPPGAGKSTAMGTFRRHFPGLVHFGVRVFFERQTDQGTPIGQRAKYYADRKIWYPDELIAEGLAGWLTEILPHASGIVLESLPRSTALAIVVDRALGDVGLRVDRVVYLHAPDEVCADRVMNREVCTNCDTYVADAIAVPDSACLRCGRQLVRRPDDDPATFHRRLRRLRDGEVDLLAHYERRGVVVRIDGTRPPSRVVADLEAAAPAALLAATRRA
ncbi:MAG: nucleoside monophosphate kinase [Jatrophihabitantaceae bacterium]